MKRFKVFSIVLIFLFTLSLSRGSLTENLLAYWPFDSNFTEVTGNVSTFTLHNGVDVIQSATFCKIGGCANMTISGIASGKYLSVNTSRFPIGNTVISFCGWFYISGYVESGGYFSYGTAAGTAMNSFYMEGRKTKVWNYAAASTASTTSFNDSELYSICVTKNAGNIAFYLNGLPDGTSTLSNSVTIGALQDFGTYWSGDGVKQSFYVDEVYIWNSALTAQNVSDWYIATRSGYKYPYFAPPPALLTINSNMYAQNFIGSSLTVTYNGSFSNHNTDLANCSFYANGLNQSSSDVNLSNLNNFTITFGDIEKNFTMNISCSNYELSSNTPNYVYWVDNYDYDAILLREVQDIKSKNANISEVLTMLPLVLLYALFMVLGYIMLKDGSLVAGFLLLSLTVGIDFYLVGYFYDNLIVGNIISSVSGRLNFIFGVFLIIWIMAKISLPFIVRFRKPLHI